MEVDTIAKQHPGGKDFSAFYVMHYMDGIIKATKHKQVLIIPAHKSLLIKLNNVLHVTLLQRCLLIVCAAVGYKGANHSRHVCAPRTPGYFYPRWGHTWRPCGVLIINNSLNPTSLYPTYYCQLIVYCQKYSCMWTYCMDLTNISMPCHVAIMVHLN